MNNTLKQYAHTLRLSGLLSTLELRLKEAEANRLPYQQFLESIFQDEINVREQRTIARRHKAADFREIRSLDNFDFAFNPSIDRARVYELAACPFSRQQRDVLLVGPPGVGKKPSRSSHRNRGYQGRLPGALPLGVRPGARTLPRGDPSWRESSARKISQARSPAH
jgi:hypothetical protein